MLEQHTHAAAVFVQFAVRQSGQIAAVYQYPSLLRMNLAGNQAHQRGFTAAGAAHNGGKRTLADAEIHIVEDGAFAISKRNVLHFDKRGGHGREKAGRLNSNDYILLNYDTL